MAQLLVMRAAVTDRAQRLARDREGEAKAARRTPRKGPIARLAIVESVIHQHHRSFKIEIRRLDERQPVLVQVYCILGGIKFDLHNLIVATEK